MLDIAAVLRRTGAMGRFDFKLPDVGEGIAEAEIVAWHVRVGDLVAEDQPIVDVMTDKATVAMESPVAGRVVALAGQVGERVPIGSVLIRFETGEGPLGDGEVAPTAAMAARLSVTDSAPAPPAEPTAEPASVETKLSPRVAASAAGGGKVLASPAVRQRARDLGIDLAQVAAAGERIRHADLDSYLLGHCSSVASRAASPRLDEQVRVVGLRRQIAERMAEAQRRIPHFTLVEENDLTALEHLRSAMNADRGGRARLTLLPFLISAMARAIASVPQVNATYDDEAQLITRWGAVHMGVATQTPNGLMVPVIRNAEALGLGDLAREIGRLAEAARTGSATRADLSGSTITISSLGKMGGIVSTPVVNRPEVAIVAVNRLHEVPVAVDGRTEIRSRMNLSLSCDHRVVDGWDAALFLQQVKALLEEPQRLLAQTPPDRPE